MTNRLAQLFEHKQGPVLNVYCTAGYPRLQSTTLVLAALQEHGADIIEIGIPYSDPLADGPVIQHSSSVALENGMSISLLFEQLKNVRENIRVPLLLMGYMNPVLQYGMEKFCESASAVGIDGLILPDLPLYEYETEYRSLFRKYELNIVFLVTPETGEERIRKLDSLCSGFIYAVSSSATTGNSKSIGDQEAWFQRLKAMKLNNPVLVGFGISNREDFLTASKHTHGAIIGSAYIKTLDKSPDIEQSTKDFLKTVLG